MEVWNLLVTKTVVHKCKKVKQENNGIQSKEGKGKKKNSTMWND